MSLTSKLASGIRRPRQALLDAGWNYHRKVRGRTGRRIVEADWDSLVILDGCRYDLFADVNDLDGELTSVVSRGSHTGEFLRRNFKADDQVYGDIVYVSANPQLRNHGVEQYFFETVPVWEQAWDDDVNTVHPADMTSVVADVADRFPHKRIVAHYVQPHYPFIGATGRQIEHRTIEGDGIISVESQAERSIWELLRDGDVSEDVVWSAYRENLEIALDHVSDLVETLSGKTVVTSDHGNAFGQFGVYGHPSRRFLESLVKVPWLETPTRERREIVAEERRESDVEPSESVDDRLAHLGYK